MVAALVRLLHSGPQDQRLLPKLGPTDVSAYVRVLTRAGRFTTQWSRLDFQQKPNFGTTAFCQLPVKGHLLTRLYLVTTLPDIYTPQAAAVASAGANFAGPRFGWTNSIGHALIGQATFTSGGTRLETLESRLLEMLDEFDTPLEKLVNRNAMIGRLDNGFTETSLGNSTTPTKLYIPLPFFFSRNDLGSALPVDALNVDELRVGITFRPVNGVYYTDSRSQTPVATDEGSGLWPILGSQFYTKAGGTSVEPGLALNKVPQTSPVSPIAGITMPLSLSLGDTYLLAEYIYLDKPEANRFRLGDIELPITQFVRIEPRDTKGFRDITIPLTLPNPTRHLYFMAQNWQYSRSYNAFFLATKDVSGSSATYAPWWPDASGLTQFLPGYLVPAFSLRGSEPFTSMELLYEGSFVRTSTENCALYRSILPSLEERKSPWVNRYVYSIPFGQQAGYFPASVPMGNANMGRIQKKDLRFGIADGFKTPGTPQRLWIYVYAENYNILRIFGGRATALFAY